jgi:uncharacterized DUF497 family protein
MAVVAATAQAEACAYSTAVVTAALHLDPVYKGAYIGSVDVEWDSEKARSNLRKRDVDFADAAVALEDERALTIEDTGYSEQRFVSLYIDPTARVLVVVFTLRGDALRIISARPATRTEIRSYEGAT